MLRKAILEPLESRQLCASDWHNAVLPCDADRTELVTPLDALVVINAINRNLADLSLAVGSSPVSDPNGNGVVLGESITFVGQTGVSAKISLAWPDEGSNRPITTIADADGHFQMVVPVGSGVHRVRLTATDELGRTILSSQEIRRGNHRARSVFSAQKIQKPLAEIWLV
jgi:hypothetical protein